MSSVPPSGSTFTDWQQVEDETALFVDEDFSWSEVPKRRRQPASAVAEREVRPRLRRTVSRDPLISAPEPVRAVRADSDEQWDGYAQSHAERAEAEFNDARRQWSASYGDSGAESFDRDDAASYANARVMEDRSGVLDLRHSGRRTVVITGRGDSRYTLAPARRRSAELRFHERSGFNPDRTAMWAVLLGIALLIGCIAR